MDIREYADRISELYGVVGNIAEYTVMPGAKEMLASIKRRVVEQGIGTSGNKIGNYSISPIYAYKSQFVNKSAFQPRGKSFSGNVTVGDKLVRTKSDAEGGLRYRPVKANNRARKTMYLPQGYKELRDVQGFETGFMNQKYSGKMVNDFQAESVEDGALLGITTERSAEIYRGQTAKRGDFYPPNEQEKQQYIISTSARIERLFRGVVSGQELTPTIS